MRLVRNTGTDSVLKLLHPHIIRDHRLDVLTPTLSLFAFSEMSRQLHELAGCRLVLPIDGAELSILGTPADRPARNRLQSRWLAKRLLQWVNDKAEVRHALGSIPQAARRTNAFVIPDTAERLKTRSQALRECERLEAEITRLRAAAAKEKQMACQVELKRIEAARDAAQEKF